MRGRTRCVSNPIMSPWQVACPNTKIINGNRTSSRALTQVVDYRAVDLVGHLSANYSSPEKQFDVIYDCAGLTTALYPSSPAYLNPTGIFVDICVMAVPKETGGQVRSFVRLMERTWRPSWLGGTPRRYKSAFLLAHTSVRWPGSPYGRSGRSGLRTVREHTQPYPYPHL